MTYSLSSWRLIQTPPAPGAWNMAIDEAILEAAGRGEVLPTLRLYAWNPPCLSLGVAQPAADVAWEAIRANGWEVVRRPTGGRAILHTDELTYSVASPQDEPRLSGSVLESYRVLSQALLDALHLLNIPAQALEKPDGRPDRSSRPAGPGGAAQNPVCFEEPSNYEITVDGKKLVGSAQARRKEGVLQHGSLPLSGDLTRILQALHFPDEAKRAEAAPRLLARAMTAEQALGYPLDWDQAAQAFTHAFQQALNIQLLPGELTSGELQRAQELVEGKFASPQWTGRV
jgi:lipoyl(octanoyl) transferase